MLRYPRLLSTISSAFIPPSTCLSLPVLLIELIVFWAGGGSSFHLSSDRRAQSRDESSRWRAKEHMVIYMVGKEAKLNSEPLLPATSPDTCPDE